MGLDMYLEKRNYVKQWEHKGDDNVEVTVVTRHGEQVSHIKSKRVTYVNEEVGYWRKVNHIHNWFVENVQEGKDDCGDYWVNKEDLEKLLDLCKQIIEDPSKAEELLPTRSGFFFGGTEYDEYYMNSIKYTINILEEVLSEVDERGYLHGEIYYTSSW
jgi:hypothetical protein